MNNKAERPKQCDPASGEHSTSHQRRKARRTAGRLKAFEAWRAGLAEAKKRAKEGTRDELGRGWPGLPPDDLQRYAGNDVGGPTATKNGPNSLKVGSEGPKGT